MWMGNIYANLSMLVFFLGIYYGLLLLCWVLFGFLPLLKTFKVNTNTENE